MTNSPVNVGQANTPEIVYWCESCDVWVTPENASKHPNGFGGHVVVRWERRR